MAELLFWGTTRVCHGSWHTSSVWLDFVADSGTRQEQERNEANHHREEDMSSLANDNDKILLLWNLNGNGVLRDPVRRQGKRYHKWWKNS